MPGTDRHAPRGGAAEGEGRGSRILLSWVQILVLLLEGWVNLGELFDLSGPQLLLNINVGYEDKKRSRIMSGISSTVSISFTLSCLDSERRLIKHVNTCVL